MDHERKVCLVHNPKCRGISLKNGLGLRTDNAFHRFPTLNRDGGSKGLPPRDLRAKLEQYYVLDFQLFGY